MRISKASLLSELFGNGSSGIGISYLRLSIGSSDLNASVFSYDDMPSGQMETAVLCILVWAPIQPT